MKRALKSNAAGFLQALALLSFALLSFATPSFGASLQEVQSFGNNPSNARMFLYVPDNVAPSPPVLVALHYCGGTANAYFTGTGYRGLADQYGFLVIYGQTTSSDGCWDVHSDATLEHGMGGDSAAIVSMVGHTVAQYAGNAGRVYVTGTSSGAMMTNVLLGAYPDVFKAGAAFAGVPYACFAGVSAWSNACATGQISRTGQQWGDLVRAAYPGYTGARPRMQLWHGTADETLNFNNFGEAIKQWTNVLGVSETPTSTEQNTPQAGFVRTRYADGTGIVRVEAVREQGVTHNLGVAANDVIRFFGLDGTTDPGGGGGSGGAPSGGSGGVPNGGVPNGGVPSGGTPSGGTPSGGGSSAGSGALAGATSGGAAGASFGGALGSGGAGGSALGGASSAAAGSASSGGAMPGIGTQPESAGCSCRAGARSAESPGSWPLWLGALGLVLGWRRRARRAPGSRFGGQR